MIIIMSWLKQILIFLLVVITIYSTLLFYVFMSVHADSRLQEIDYLEKQKLQWTEALYMDRVQPLNQRLHHFTVSLIRLRKNRPSHCKQPPEKALLIISASSFDLLSIYNKMLRQLKTGVDQCQIAQVFTMRKNGALLLSNEDNIKKYAFEIGEIIKYLTIQAQFQLSIFSHEEGAMLTLAYFTKRTINLLFTNIIQKISSITLVDLTHPFVRIQFDPPYHFLKKLKRQIVNSKERIDIFNKLKIILISTHKEELFQSDFQFAYGDDNLIFRNTVIISTREMANVHYYLPPHSLSFPPLVRRISHFISKDLSKNMKREEIIKLFRYGQSYDYQTLDQKKVVNCDSSNYSEKGLIVSRAICLRLRTRPLQIQQSLIIYSPNHFEIYSNDFKKIYPFDNLTEGSIYLFSKLQKEIFIINQQKADIYISRQEIINPENPLNISQEELLATSQLVFSNYSIVNICPNLLLLFPLHFAQGNAQRKFLVEAQGNCFVEENILEEFSWQFFVNWSLFRNLIIFTLLCNDYRKQYLSQRIFQQFFVNLFLLLGKDQIHNKFFYALYIVSFGLLIEYVSKLILHVSWKINYIRQNLKSALLLFISAICLIGLVFGLFNSWIIFLVASLLFLSEENLTIILIKSYYLKQNIINNQANFHNIAQLGLFTMWIYISLPANRNVTSSFWTAERVFSGILIIAISICIQGSGVFIDHLISIYMKVLIVVKMMGIIKKQK